MIIYVNRDGLEVMVAPDLIEQVQGLGFKGVPLVPPFYPAWYCGEPSAAADSMKTKRLWIPRSSRVMTTSFAPCARVPCAACHAIAFGDGGCTFFYSYLRQAFNQK